MGRPHSVEPEQFAGRQRRGNSGRRRRLLRYLESSDVDRYRALVADLGLRR
jgi:ribosomal protein S15P/S13E